METSPLTTRQQITASLQLPVVQYLLLFLVVLCVYLPTFWFTYVWDDHYAIVKNESIREWKNIPLFFSDPNTFMFDPGDKTLNAWRPLRNIYFLVTYKIHGFHPAGWHFQHVLLHCLVASMLLAFFHRIYRYWLKQPLDQFLPKSVQAACFFAVLAWAVHPANNEITAWLKSADDLLACIMTLGALIILFPKDQRLTYSRVIIGGLLFSLAFLAKESIAPIPLIYLILVLGLAPSSRTVLNHGPFWLATILLFSGLGIYMVLRTIMLGQLQQVDYLAGNFSLMMATMTASVLRYLQLTFWPFWPTVQIGDYMGWYMATSWGESRVILSLCILTLVLIIITVISRRNRIFLVGWLFAAIAFTPVANILPMMQIMAERFMYFPMMGIALAASSIGVWWFRTEITTRLWLPLLICIALGTTTVARLPIWIDDETFQKKNLETIPDNWRAKYNNAMYHSRAGETTQALGMFLEILEERMDVDSAIEVTRILYIDEGITSASNYLDRVLAVFPQDVKPLAFRADLAFGAGDYAVAANFYDRAILANDALPDLWYGRGLAYMGLKDSNEARLSLLTVFTLDDTHTSAAQALYYMDSTEY